jgi:hypothetical protein
VKGFGHHAPSAHKLTFFVLTLLFGTSAQAQYYAPPVPAAMDINVAGSLYLGDEATYDEFTGKTRVPAARSRKREPVADVQLTYAVNKSLTAKNIQKFANKFRAIDPAAATQMEQLTASTDVLGMVGDVLDRYDLDRNNVAHAYALYWVVYWGLANKVADAPSAMAMQAVALQAERGFASNAGFAKMNDAQKQETAEELMLLAAILDATSERAKSDPALAEQASKASLEGSRKSGLDLDKMTLTEDGFVPAKPRKRSDASDVVTGDEKALASATPSDAAAEGSPNYALMAGAASAGLGFAFLIGKAMGKKG